MIKMVVTDLDGTLLSNRGDFSMRNLNTLHQLGNKGILRVIATGRSPYAASLAIPPDFPIDYLMFSSGAGIMKWSDKSIIYSSALDSARVQAIVDILVSLNVDFMVHEPIPQNHCFHYSNTSNANPDFARRILLYRDFCSPLIMGVPYPDSATQILVIIPPALELFTLIESQLSGVKVIRATSPLDGESIWLEIFPEGISKGHGTNWLCSELGQIAPNEILAIGNDYNDLDMLNYTPNSFVVENAPEDIKQKFKVVHSNNDSGFAEAVEMAIRQ